MVEVTKTNESTENKYFTLEEIAKHDGKQEHTIWVIIKDIVYNLSLYLEEHPGGPELIIQWAGKDATKEFEDFGHSTDAKKDLKQYKIGEVVEEQRKKKTKKVDQNNQIGKQKTPKIVEVVDAVRRKSCISTITCGIFT